MLGLGVLLVLLGSVQHLQGVLYSGRGRSATGYSHKELTIIVGLTMYVFVREPVGAEALHCTAGEMGRRRSVTYWAGRAGVHAAEVEAATVRPRRRREGRSAREGKLRLGTLSFEDAHLDVG